MATTPVDGGDLVQIALAGLASFLVVIAIAPRARRLALRRGITDQPRDGKWHTSPTPYLGGAALVLGAIGASAALPGWEIQAAVLVLGAIVVSILGLVDDIRTVSPLRRVTVEAAAGAAAFTVGARVEIFNDPLDFVLTVAWFVFVTNSFNLLDNMDGGMASIAAMVAGAIATVALVNGQVLVGGLAVVTGAACLGFLLYNWHPAQLFMGDAGIALPRLHAGGHRLEAAARRGSRAERGRPRPAPEPGRVRHHPRRRSPACAPGVPCTSAAPTTRRIG